MRSLTCLLTAVFLVTAPARAQDKKNKGPHADRAKALIESLSKKKFDDARKHFDEKLTKLLAKDALPDLWKKITDQLGELKKAGSPRPDKLGGLTVVYIPCEFAKMKLDLRVSFDKDDRINGFVFVPAKGTFTFKAPPYAKPGNYREVDLTVGAGGDWPLPATLTLPKGEGPFPAVVLVHGSGPHDRDETIGPNKPLRDLAWGLASQGVAALRYSKRTHEHSAKAVELLKSLTVKEEVTDDALAAVAAAREHKAIDPARVYLLGHSLGAFVAPRVAKADPKLAGIILLAGNSRPLEDLVVDQYTYLFGLGGKISDEDQKRLDEIKAQVARVRAKDLPADTPAKDLPLSLPASYWRDLKAYDAAATAAALKTRVLVLHGERDYQVTMDDYKGWQKALKGRKNATLKSYPALNHLFMEGEGKGKPSEYQKAGHVAKEVIDDVAEWVKRK